MYLPTARFVLTAVSHPCWQYVWVSSQHEYRFNVLQSDVVELQLCMYIVADQMALGRRSLSVVDLL